MPVSTPAIQKQFAVFDRLFDGTLDWFIELYDPAVGGFCSSLALRKQKDYKPDIQSTCQVLAGIRQSGLLESMPESVRLAIVKFIQRNQDPKSGLFWDQAYPKVLERRRDRTLARTTGFVMAWLPRLKAAPLHLVPEGEKGGFPEYLQSLEAWQQWIRSTLGEKPGYGTLDDLGSQGVFLMRMDEAQRKPFVRAAVDYVNARQDPNGLWIGPNERPQEPLDGAFKYVLFLKQIKEPIPNAQKIRASILRWLKSKDGAIVDNTCFVCNPVRLLAEVQAQLPSLPLSQADLEYLIRWHTERLSPFVQKDGGLSRYLSRFRMGIENLELGRASTSQGDVNGNAQALVAREMLYRLAGMDPPPLPKAEGFWERFIKKHRPEETKAGR